VRRRSYRQGALLLPTELRGQRDFTQTGVHHRDGEGGPSRPPKPFFGSHLCNACFQGLHAGLRETGRGLDAGKSKNLLLPESGQKKFTGEAGRIFDQYAKAIAFARLLLRGCPLLVNRMGVEPIWGD
jgi:hypothetical protein